MSEQELQKFNEIFEDYLNYLGRYSYHYLSNIEFSIELFKIFNMYPLNKLEKIQYKKMSGLQTIELVKEYFAKNYESEIKKIEEAFTNGTINIFYTDESLEKEDNIIYDSKLLVGYHHKHNNHDDVNVPLSGLWTDGALLVHEIRHLLNQPDNDRRSTDNLLLTEALSIFEEFRFLDFLKTKNIISEEEINNFLVTYLNTIITKLGRFEVLSKITLLKNEMGYFNKQNFEQFYYNSNEYKNYEIMGKSILNSYNYHFSIDENINSHEIFLYLFGILISCDMHQKYKENNNFIHKFNKLNLILKNNIQVDIFDIVDINLSDAIGIKKLEQSLKNEFKEINGISLQNNLKVKVYK